MDVVAPIVTQLQMPVLMKPTFRTLNHPAVHAKAAAVRGVAPGQQRTRSAPPQFAPMRVGVVAAIALDDLEATPWPAPLATHAWHRIDQRQQLRHIVPIRPGER